MIHVTEFKLLKQRHVVISIPYLSIDPIFKFVFTFTFSILKNINEFQPKVDISNT